MTDIIELPNNFIGIDDKVKLESFGGHTIAHGRATRWHWDKNANNDDQFEIYCGGKHEILAVRIHRDRESDAFCAHNKEDELITSGTLEHIMAELENYFIRLHHEMPDTPA